MEVAISPMAAVICSPAAATVPMFALISSAAADTTCVWAADSSAPADSWVATAESSSLEPASTSAVAEICVIVADRVSRVSSTARERSPISSRALYRTRWSRRPSAMPRTTVAVRANGCVMERATRTATAARRRGHRAEADEQGQGLAVAGGAQVARGGRVVDLGLLDAVQRRVDAHGDGRRLRVADGDEAGDVVRGGEGDEFLARAAVGREVGGEGVAVGLGGDGERVEVDRPRRVEGAVVGAHRVQGGVRCLRTGRQGRGHEVDARLREGVLHRPDALHPGHDDVRHRRHRVLCRVELLDAQAHGRGQQEAHHAETGGELAGDAEVAQSGHHPRAVDVSGPRLEPDG